MAAADEPVRKRILEAQTAAEQIDRALDFIAAELRPAVLDLGLVAALEQFVREWSVTFAIPAELHVSGVTDAQLEQEVETHLYRVAQEALHNAYKHAEASRVELIFERRGSSIVLIIEDDGCGFHPDHAATTHRGLGLLGMRERAEIVGGSLEIESAPGRGTTVFFQVPCPSRGGARVDTA
jgi:signal transduction histidine kinase